MVTRETGANDAAFPLDSQIQAVERQIHFLSVYTYPAQVGARKMTQGRADQNLAVLRAAAAALRKVRDAEAAKQEPP